MLDDVVVWTPLITGVPNTGSCSANLPVGATVSFVSVYGAAVAGLPRMSTSLEVTVSRPSDRVETSTSATPMPVSSTTVVPVTVCVPSVTLNETVAPAGPLKLRRKAERFVAFAAGAGDVIFGSSDGSQAVPATALAVAAAGGGAASRTFVPDVRSTSFFPPGV